MLLWMAPIGVLTSWATPATSRPTAAIFSDWISCAWASFSFRSASASSMFRNRWISASFSAFSTSKLTWRFFNRVVVSSLKTASLMRWKERSCSSATA